LKKENKCFDTNNQKQKKHYEKWKKLIKSLSDKANDKDKQKEKKDKPKTFEDFFPFSTITKCYINRSDYKPFLEGA
jgi:hypothetical protein